MKSFGLGTYALTGGVSVALLAGCGGSQPPIGALGTIPQTSAIATHADRGKSWMVEMSPVAASASFLSVGNDNWNHGNGDIAIFAQGKKSPIRTISAGIERRMARHSTAMETSTLRITVQPSSPGM